MHYNVFALIQVISFDISLNIVVVKIVYFVNLFLHAFISKLDSLNASVFYLTASDFDVMDPILVHIMHVMHVNIPIGYVYFAILLINKLNTINNFTNTILENSEMIKSCKKTVVD